MQNKLPRILFSAPEGFGAGILLLNSPTPYIGRIIQFVDILEMQRQIAEDKFVAFSLVPNHSILITYAGIFGKGYVISGNRSALDEVQAVLDEMAQHYFESNVLRWPYRYKRYLLVK